MAKSDDPDGETYHGPGEGGDCRGDLELVADHDYRGTRERREGVNLAAKDGRGFGDEDIAEHSAADAAEHAEQGRSDRASAVI